MALLDAVTALAVTMAALATTVTIVMEVWVRIFRLRRRAQLRLFQRIFEDAVAHRFPAVNEPAEFIGAVLRNPLHHAGRRGNEEASSGLTRNSGARKGIYEWVSHEHVFRRLLELEGVVEEGREQLTNKLRAFCRKYDELCSAASTDFKERRRLWSLVGGVLLALVLNVDGLRIYKEYRADPRLAATVAAEVDRFEAAATQAEQQLAQAQDERSAADDLKRAVERLNQSVSAIGAIGIPIGWQYPPYCLLGPGCKDNAGAAVDEGQPAEFGWVSAIGWLLAVLGTGLLIGLGAPFWFDVARRLAEVRGAFGGKGTGEQAHSGESIATPERREEAAERLIRRVVDETLADRSGKVRRLLVNAGDS